MDFGFEHLTNITIAFLLTISLCNATLQSLTRFTEKKSVATSHTTLQKVSKMKCVEKCNKERLKGTCNLAGYDKRTQTCYLSNDDPLNALDTDDEMTGVFSYESYETGTIKSCLNQNTTCIGKHLKNQKLVKLNW